MGLVFYFFTKSMEHLTPPSLLPRACFGNRRSLEPWHFMTSWLVCWWDVGDLYHQRKEKKMLVFKNVPGSQKTSLQLHESKMETMSLVYKFELQHPDSFNWLELSWKSGGKTDSSLLCAMVKNVSAMGFMAIQPLGSLKPEVFTCGKWGNVNPLHPNPNPYSGLFSVPPKKNQWLFFSTPTTGHVAKHRTLWNAKETSRWGERRKEFTDEKGKRRNVEKPTHRKTLEELPKLTNVSTPQEGCFKDPQFFKRSWVWISFQSAHRLESIMQLWSVCCGGVKK